ncbi:unnamed protein product [Moneuplotes crassus]|uniref:Uncharacterized protein n=1 Tax=Euplotes crassus TaxID=5936 RepID=A0AAD1U4W1_EUPCR|nr:unnamed protein product [Moneuplotes crassus]
MLLTDIYITVERRFRVKICICNLEVETALPNHPFCFFPYKIFGLYDILFK